MKNLFYLSSLLLLLSSKTWAQTSCGGILGWLSNSVYTQGNQATYNGHLYTAQWWTQGDVPGANQWGPWQDQGTCSSSTTSNVPTVNCNSTFLWDSTATYVVGNQAVMNNSLYTAQWWNQDQSPVVNSGGSWVMNGTCLNYHSPTNQCSNVSPWLAGQAYNNGNQVVYNGTLYQAKWWTQNEQPGANVWGAWESKGVCTVPYVAPTTNCFGIANWNTGAIYTVGLQAAYNDTLYTAKWWTQGNVPSSSNPNGAWQLVMACTPPLPPQDGLVTWNPGSTYNKGDLVVYTAKIYQATTASSNVVPTTTTSWQYERPLLVTDVVKYYPTCTDVLTAMNSVMETTVMVPITDESAISSLDLSSFSKSITYYDALGRPIQRLDREVTPAGNDIVSFNVYDANGRRPTSYIPFVSTVCGGAFINDDPTKPINVNVMGLQNTYYSTNTDPLIPQSNTPFSQTVYESSPLGRVIQQATTGDSWALSNGKTTTKSYSVNVANEVHRWVLDETSFNMAGAGYYNPGELIKVTTTDVNGGQHIVYADTYGRLVMEQQIASDQSDALQTYNVYNRKNLLVYSIPPAAVKQLATNSSNWQILATDPINQSLLTFYVYDNRNRMVQERIPGVGGPTITLYDQADHPILMQSPTQAVTGEWFFNKFDALGRLILYGTYIDTRSSTDIIANIVAEQYTYEIAGTQLMGYTDRTFPSETAPMTVLKVNYYDSYDINRTGTPAYSYTGANNRLLGAVTVSYTKSWDTNWLKTVSFYDEYGRVINSQSNNHLYIMNQAANPANVNNLNDSETNTYDFSGKLLMSTKIHDPGLAATNVMTVQKSYVYDHAQRLQYSYHQVNSEPMVLMSYLNYSEIGALIRSNLHLTSDQVTFLQGVDYRYNIKGWLTHINNGTLTNDNGVTNSDGNDLFGMDFLYDQTNSLLGNTARYDGNISLATWETQLSSGNSGVPKAYVYSYDHFGNMSNSLYYEQNAPNAWTASSKFNEQITGYDGNGNITGLVRYDNTGSLLDNLAYTYNGNQLTAVKESATNTTGAGFIQGSTATTQYVYDSNGRLISDLNKQITIAYNNLDLIQTVTSTTGQSFNTLNYEYDSDGNMLARIIINNGTTTRNDYVDEYLYQGGVLDYFMTSAGRVEVNNGSFDYRYHIKDQLGNVRVTFDQLGNAPEMLESNDFYAFGLRQIEGLNTDYKFYYEGKEWQDPTSLYDFGARQYDPVLGRWQSPDPSNQYYSPYMAMGNNPVNLIDPDGRSVMDNKADDIQEIHHMKSNIAVFTGIDIVVAVAVAILTDGADLEAAIAPIVSDWGFSTASEAAVGSVMVDAIDGAIVGGASGAIGGLGMGIITQDANLGADFLWGLLGGAVGGAASGVVDFIPGMDDLDKYSHTLSEGVKGIAGGFAGGFVNGVGDAQMHHINNNFNNGITEGVFSGAAGGVLGMVNGAVEDIKGKAYGDASDKISGKNGGVRTRSFREALQLGDKGESLGFFRTFDAFFAQGNGLSVYFTQFVGSTIDSFGNNTRDQINQLWGGESTNDQ